MFVSEIYAIEDCWYYSTGINVDTTNWDKSSNISVTSDSTGITITGTNSSESRAFPPTNEFGTSDNVMFEFETVTGSNYKLTVMLALLIGSNSGVLYANTYGDYKSIFGSSEIDTGRDYHSGDVIRIERINGDTKLFINNTQVQSVTKTMNAFKFGFYSTNNRSQTIKNIKVKQL